MLLTLIMNLLFQEVAVPMADALRESGKIWVVVGVILIAFLGIILYLISLDRKITKLEKES